MNKPVNLEYDFTERARAKLKAEGLHSHTTPTASYPTTPQRDDLIRFDWLLNGAPFIVMAREFIVSSDHSLSVRLWLDLPEDHPH